MVQFNRKQGITPPNILEPIAPVKPAADDDCGCHGGTGNTGDGTGGGSCPTDPYVTGGFSLVSRNNTTGKCEVLDLDFIEDSQPDWP